ncbi:MAG: hypothetical protein DPW16_09365 [Chloroflexi bacterium]|nr:hypothetical protein [Chloroflexota bacterium]
MKKSHIRIIISGVLVSFWIFFLASRLLQNVKSDDYDCVREVADPRIVLSSDRMIDNLWNLKIRISNAAKPGSYVVEDDGLLILSDSACHKVVAFDLLTGNIVWEKDLAGDVIVVDPNRDDTIYVLVGNGSQRQIWALNSLTGLNLWKNDSLDGQRVGLVFQVDPNGQISLYNRQSTLYFLNDQTGQFEKIIEVPDETLTYYDGILLEQNGAALEAKAVDSGESLWVWEDWEWSSNLRIEPVIRDNLIFVENAGKLAVIDLISGKLLWKFDEELIASTLAFDSEKIYFLSHSNKLVTLDLETGNIVYTVQFEQPSETEYDSLEDSYVIVNENVVGMYFQDTQVLSVLEVN